MNQFSPETTHSAKTAIADDRSALNGRLRLDSHWEGQTFSEFISSVVGAGDGGPYGQLASDGIWIEAPHVDIN